MFYMPVNFFNLIWQHRKSLPLYRIQTHPGGVQNICKGEELKIKCLGDEISLTFPSKCEDGICFDFS